MGVKEDKRKTKDNRNKRRKGIGLKGTIGSCGLVALNGSVKARRGSVPEDPIKRGRRYEGTDNSLLSTCHASD